MILSKSKAFVPLTLILSFGLDPALLRTRSMVLQSAGYLVTSASSLKEAVDNFLAGDFDLILLGRFIPAKERERLTCLIRASGSRIPIVSTLDVFDRQDALADKTLENDTNKLLTVIKEVLAKAAKMQAMKTAY